MGLNTFNLLLSLLACLPCSVPASSTSRQRLLLILLDGFRHDYLSQPHLPLPGFDQLARRGVKVGGLVPDFPSLSYPNYYSLMTGLHTGSHGMTGNFMYDVSRQEAFLIGTNPEQFHAHWWNHAEPLWITAAKQNKSSVMFYWPGCEVQIQGHRPAFCRNYTGVPSLEDFRSALNTSLSALETGKTDMAAVYFELTDKYGHLYGPFSAKLNQTLRDLDPIMSDLVDRLSDPAMSEVNLMIFSDHGMTKVGETIDISEVVDRSEYLTIMDAGAVVGIYPVPGKEQQVYDKLVNFHPNMTVYRQSDLPERWHYKHGPYVAAVTAVADLGFLILTGPSKERSLEVPVGTHGYDNAYSDMQGIFLAMGPAFKAGQQVDKLLNVDLYQVMCRILHLPPSPNNGTYSDVMPLLTDVSSAASVVTSLSWLTVFCYSCSWFWGVFLLHFFKMM